VDDPRRWCERGRLAGEPAGAARPARAGPPGLYLEWRPDGATNSVFYEVRGPATWKPNYRWVQFAGIHSLTCEIQVPVAPLAVGAPIVIGPFTQDLPAVIELDQTIPGDATALMTVKIALPSGIGLAPHGV
jgi:hypothetical protein